MNEQLQEDHSPGGVELGGLKYVQKHSTSRWKKHTVQIEKQVFLQSFIPDTHPCAHTPSLNRPLSPHSLPPHWQDYQDLLWGVRGCPAHKETLGDRISRLTADSHMSSSSNWYSKLYTFKCHQERAKPTRAFLCSGCTFMRGGSFGKPTMRP